MNTAKDPITGGVIRCLERMKQMRWVIRPALEGLIGASIYPVIALIASAFV